MQTYKMQYTKNKMPERKHHMCTGQNTHTESRKINNKQKDTVPENIFSNYPTVSSCETLPTPV